MDDGSEPIADEELLYRRIPASTGWYDPLAAGLKPEAFAPHKTNGATGLFNVAGQVQIRDRCRARAAGQSVTRRGSASRPDAS